MNKIFKVVWSKSKQCYVVVSEMAKNNSGKKRVLASVLAALAVVSAGGVGSSVQAATDLGNSSVNISPNGAYNGSNHVGSNSIVVGYQNTTDNNWGTVAIGAANTATENSAVAVGNGNEATGGAAAAFGAYNKAKGRASVAIGNVSMASGDDSIAIGNRANSNPANQDRGSGQFSIAMGSESWARGTDNISIGHNAVTDSSGDSIAIGRDSTTNSVNTVTIGAQTKATGGYAVAIGRESEVNANFATAMGYQSKAKGSASIAIGKQNNSNLGDTITMGNSNTANTMGGIAIGKNNIADSSIGDPTTATKENSQIAIGRDNKATSMDTVAIGREAESTKTGAVSLGARTKAKGDYAVALGSASENKTVEAADYAVAVGAMSKATGERSVAVGGGAEASAARAVANGYRSSASVEDGVALGSYSKATVDKGIQGFNPATGRTNKYSDQAGAVGTSTLAAVSVGDGANATRQITGLAAGTEDTDAVNVAQLKNVNLKFAGNSGNGDVLLKDGTLNVKGEGLISTSADNDGIKVKLTQGGPITADNTGKAKEPTNNGVATTQNVVQAINNSGWNATAGSEDGGTHTGNPVSAIVKPGNTVAFVAGKNLNVEQRVGSASTGGDQEYIYSLNKDVDLTKDGSLTIGDTKIVNDGLTITGGPSITKTGINAGNKTITNVSDGVNNNDAVNVSQLKAVAAKERHIKPGSYAVDNDGNVTMTYVDGDGKDVAGDKAIITGVANQDLSNITNNGETKIKNLAKSVINMEDGKNTKASSRDVNGVKTFKVDVEGDLTGITSISNTTTGPKMEIGANSINITNGPINMGGSKIVNVAPGTDDTDAVNYSQIKGLRTEVKAGNNVNVTKTQGGDGHDIYTIDATSTGGAASSWKVNTSATDGTHSGATTQTISDQKKVDLQAGKNLTVKQTNTTDGADVEFALNKDVDLTKDGSLTIGDTKIVNDGLTITGGPSITKTGINAGNKTITNVSDGVNNNDAVNVSQLKAVAAKERHIKPGSYAVDNDGNVTMTYVDGDGKDVAGDKAIITGVANQDLSNITNNGETKIKNLAKSVINMEDGKNTKASSRDVNGVKTFKVDVEGDLTGITSISNTTTGPKMEIGANSINITNGPINMGGSKIVNVAPGTDDTDAVNVKQLKAAKTVVEAGSNVTVTKNTGSNGEDVYTVSASGGGTTTASSWNVKSTGNTDSTSEPAAKTISNGNTVEMAAGKNLTVKQTSDANGAKVEFALNKDLSNLDKVVVNGKDGVNGHDGVTIIGPQGAAGATGIPGTNGIDGKVGISGKDGKDAVSIAGKDGVGTIGLTGPQGPAGADGKGVDISTDHGTQTLVKQEANNDNKSERIVYVPKDKDGNPLKDGDGNTIKREVATMDDGLKFKGDNATVIKKPLGEQLDIIGGATGSLSDNNIGVNEDNGKLKVQLAKTIDLTKDGSVTTGNTKVDNGGVTITAPTGGTTTNVSLTQSGLDNGGNKIVNVKEGTADTDAVNVKQLKDAKTVLVDGKNTKKEGSGTAADPYKVNVEGALVDISSITNGSGSGKLSFGPNQTVTVDGDHSITLNAKTGKIGGLQNKTFDPNNFTSGQAATEDQLKSVHDTLKASELHIAPTTGTTEDKGGTASGSTNVYKYDATNKTVTLTYNDGNGQAVSGPKAVIDFSALNVTPGNNYGFNTNAGGNLATGTTANVKPVASGKTVTYAAGKNLTVEQKETNGDLTYTYALDKDLTNLDKIVVNGKDGQPGHDGVTITGPQGTAGVDGNNGKVGISGKDGKDAVSISGKDGVGHIGLTGPAGKDGKDATADITVKDGVPGVDGAPGDSMTRIVYKDKDGKDHEVATHDDGMKFAGDNGQTNQDTNPNVIKKHLNNVVDIIGGATGTLTDNNIGVNADNGKLKVQLAKDINLTKDGSLTIGGTKVDGNGLTITGGPSVTKTGIDAGNKAITNVANGTNDSDAVNVSQLKGSITTVKSSDGSITVTDANAGSTDPTKGHAYDIKVNNQGVVNNAQLPVEYTKADGTKVYKQPNGSFNTAKDGSGDVVNAGDVIASMNNGSDSTTTPMKLANVGSSIAGQSGSTYLDKINAAASNPNTTNNAVNVSDLKDTAKAIGDKGLNFGAQSGTDIHKNLGEKLEIVGGGQKADSEYDASNIKTMTKDGKVVVALDKNIKADTVTVGKDGKDGVDGKIGVNGKDGASVTINGKDGSIGLQGPKGADGKDGASATIKVKDGVPGVDGKDGETLTRIVYETKDGVEHQVATHDDGLKFTGNNTSTVNKHHLNSLVKVQGEGVTEAQSTSFQSAAGNINVKANGTDTLEVQLNKDLKGINSIRNSATGPAMAFDTGDIAISGGNLNMGDNKITNVGPGTDGTDAVNLNQLKAARTVVTSKDGSVTVTPNENQATHEMTYDLKVNGAHDPRVDQLNEEIGRVGAQGAALAALKPIQYDPLEPTQIMAGYGNYRGNSALAVGVAHYKNESTMLHAGMSWAGGSSHMMANAGVTWKFGNRDAENAIADRYRKGPISAAYALQNEMAAVKAQNAGLKSEVSDLKAENQQMKAQIAAMMAKLGL